MKPGTRLDEEGKVSLTPEFLALKLAARLRGLSVLDATCGAGGDTIALATARCTVTAVDSNAARLKLARHNARLYGVEKRIEFVCGDAVETAASRSADVLYVDPPWGVDWSRTRTSLDDFSLLSDLLSVVVIGSDATVGTPGHYGTLIAKVPPSFDTKSLPYSTPEGVFGEFEGDFRRVKFVLLWLGKMAAPGRR